ncbi:nucleotide exchange factor GrpE [Desulfatiferula olefinivorans]
MSKKQEKAEKNDSARDEEQIPEQAAGAASAEGDGPADGVLETDPVKALELKLQLAEQAAAQSHERLLRASAEYDNFKKRAQREAEEFRKFANETLIKELLPVIDNLERAVESSGTAKDGGNGIVQGVEMTLREIYKILERFNLKALDSEGKPFDPNFHQAVLQEESEEHPENTVLKEMQKGYLLHDRLIRPAMVVVAKAPIKENDSQPSVQASADQTDD